MNLESRTYAAVLKILDDHGLENVINDQKDRGDSFTFKLVTQAFETGYKAGCADQYAKDHTRTSPDPEDNFCSNGKEISLT